jgi:predicted nucleotidyltransferase
MPSIVEAARQALQSSAEPILAAYLFGSHAAGHAHAESDVDVAVLFDRTTAPDAGDRARRALALAGDLIAATHVNRVDVLVLNDAPPELAARVLCEGIRLVCRDQEADHAFTRRTLLLAADQAPFLRRTRRLKLEAIVR